MHDGASDVRWRVDPIDGTLNFVLASDIHLERHDRQTKVFELGSSGVEMSTFSGGNRHPCAIFGQIERDRLTDPGSSACHQRDLVGQHTEKDKYPPLCAKARF
jgi:hypothetical protein